jgi:hypothetical protein
MAGGSNRELPRIGIKTDVDFMDEIQGRGDIRLLDWAMSKRRQNMSGFSRTHRSLRLLPAKQSELFLLFHFSSTLFQLRNAVRGAIPFFLCGPKT